MSNNNNNNNTEKQLTSAALSDICKKWLTHYTNKAGISKYQELCNMIAAKHGYILEIPFEDLIGEETMNALDYPTEYQLFIDAVNSNGSNMNEFLQAMGYAFFEHQKETHPAIYQNDTWEENSTNNRFQVRLISYLTEKPIASIVPEDIGKFFEFKGIVAEMTSDLPQYFHTKVYKCDSCSATVEVRNKNFFNQKPKPQKCPACGEKSLEFDEEQSIRKGYGLNYNIIEIQELPEKATMERMGMKLKCIVLGDDLVRKVIPADRIKLTGFISLMPTFESKESSTYDPFIQVNHLQSINKTEDIDLKKYYPEIRRLINEKGRDYVFNKIIRSIAPDVVGNEYEVIKLSLALQAVGAPARKKAGGNRVRGDINIALLGDAGTAKTDLANYMRLIVPRSIKSSQMSSQVGLTGSIDVSDKGKGAKVRPGVVMLGNGGLVIIEEADKLDKKAIEGLPTVMDDTQTLTLAKAGIVKEYPIFVYVLSLGNPIGGEYDNTKKASENFTFETWWWQRQDAIWIMKQAVKKEEVELITDSVIGSIVDSVPEKAYEKNLIKPELKGDIFDPEFIKACIAFCRENYEPDFKDGNLPKAELDQLFKLVRNFYVNLKMSEDTKSISPRILNSISRWILASARLHARNHIEEIDVKIAISIMTEWILRTGMNPETGKFESKNLNFNKDNIEHVREMKKLAVKVAKEVLLKFSASGGFFTLKEVEEEMKKKISDVSIIKQVLANFEEHNVIYHPAGFGDMIGVRKDELDAVK